MQFLTLNTETINAIKNYRFDRIINKHEGPWNYGSLFDEDELEFINAEGFWVLLPVAKDYHQNISIKRVIISKDENSLTIFLKDTTWLEDNSDEFSEAGFLAVCDRFINESFFIAHVYHEWFMVEN